MQDLIAHINTVVIPALAAADQAALTAMGTTFTESTDGQLVIDTEGSIIIDGQNSANPMGQTGLDYLGLVDNVGSATAPVDPYFDVQIGNNDPVRITIEPGDTHTELLAKLQAVNGLAVDTTNFALDGFLRIRPGNDFDNPDFGGDLKITGGPFATSSGTLGSPPAAAGRTSIDDGVGIVSALFGTYSAGPPVTDGNYLSDIDHDSFRTTNLGGGAGTSTNIIGTDQIRDFGQRMVYEQTSQLSAIEDRITDEDTLRSTLEEQFLNDSSVNIDEELGNLIVFQTAYSAAARVVSAIEQMFNELLNAVR